MSEHAKGVLERLREELGGLPQIVNFINNEYKALNKEKSWIPEKISPIAAAVSAPNEVANDAGKHQAESKESSATSDDSFVAAN